MQLKFLKHSEISHGLRVPFQFVDLTCSSGKAQRLLLITGFMGCSSVEHWIAHYPRHAHIVCRITLLAIALVNTRHVQKLCSLPWSICSLGDGRISLHERQQLQAEWRRKQPCCLPFGFARSTLTDKASDMTEQLWQRILFFAGWSLKLSTAVIERLHARNRRSADPQTAGETNAYSVI